MKHSFSTHTPWCGAMFSLLLLLAGNLQRSNAQNSQLPDYGFRVSLPPNTEQSDRLNLPELPFYDRANLYLQVRDSSQDWYDINILNEEAQQTIATNQTFAPQTDTITAEPSSNTRQEIEGKASRLLDANKRILPAPRNVLLDQSLAPIPRYR